MSSDSHTCSLLDLARQIWALLDTSERRECALVLLISVTAACLTLVGVAGIAPFFAVLADPTVIDRSAALARLRQVLELDSSHDILVLLGVGFVALLSLANLSNVLTVLSIGRFAQRVGARLHTQLFDEYLHRDLGFHSANNSAVLATRIVQDVNRTVGGVLQGGLTFCASAVVIVLITGAIVVIDPVVALAAAAVLTATYAVIYALIRPRLIRNGAILTTHWNARAQVIAESFTAIKDVLAHRGQSAREAVLARHSAAIAAAQASTPALAASPKHMLECITAAGLVAAALWIYGTTGAERWLTNLAFLGFAAYRLLPAMQQAFAALARIHAERSSFDAIADDLRCARLRRTTPLPAPVASAQWRGRPRRLIRLVDVSYRYGAGRGGVTGVSLEIRAGTIAGFVGPNGAGKSTLAELVLGLLVPASGSVEIDGEALDAGNRNAWLDTVAYVPQQIAIMDGTIAQNIAFGVPADELDLARLVAAAHGAQLEPVIDALPDGIATVVGERGTRLSGGERQRVAIARALYRRASLLVMDEGTNALDALCESEVVTMFDALRADCTMILIGHHPSALRYCDVLFEIDEGRLAACATTAGLAASAPPWRALRR